MDLEPHNFEIDQVYMLKHTSWPTWRQATYGDIKDSVLPVKDCKEGQSGLGFHFDDKSFLHVESLREHKYTVKTL